MTSLLVFLINKLIFAAVQHTIMATKPPKFLSYVKYAAVVLIVIGILTLLMDDTAGSEMPLLIGLFTLLITTDKFEDERSVQIKTTSLYFAFVIAYAVKLLTTNLYDHALISFELVEINHFIILMLSLANIVFYGRLYVLKR